MDLFLRYHHLYLLNLAMTVSPVTLILRLISFKLRIIPSFNIRSPIKSPPMPSNILAFFSKTFLVPGTNLGFPILDMIVIGFNPFYFFTFWYPIFIRFVWYTTWILCRFMWKRSIMNYILYIINQILWMLKMVEYFFRFGIFFIKIIFNLLVNIIIFCHYLKFF